MICEYCNKTITHKSHLGSCKSYALFLDHKIAEKGDDILNLYDQGYTIHELINNFNIGRNRIEKHIVNSGRILRGFNFLGNRKNEKTKQTLFKKYGVINPGQLTTGGYGMLNTIPYKKPSFYSTFIEYRKQVELLTQKYIKQLKKEKRLPKQCYFTGILFADEKNIKVNPNDWYKRTVDHKKSVLLGFLQNETPEVVANPDNIIFVLKYVNTIKGNMPEDVFKQVYSNFLINILCEN